MTHMCERYGSTSRLAPRSKSKARLVECHMDTLIIAIMIAQLAVAIYVAWKSSE